MGVDYAPHGVVITLDDIEYYSTLYAGVLLHDMSTRMGLKDKMIKPGACPIELNQIGLLGERVAAKALDLYFGASARTFAKPDLSHNIEVRTISKPSLGLKVRPRDDDNKRMVGVLIPDDLSTRKFTVAGWILAGEAKQKRWSKNPYGRGEFYGVPLEELWPLEELMDIIYMEKAT